MTIQERSPTNVEDGVQVITRIIDAPRRLVFEAWTDSAHLVHWWGRKDFTLPVCVVDFRPGGDFRLRMRSPAGDDYWVRGIYHEIVEPERIVMRCGLECEAQSHDALWTITFTEVDGKTALTIRQELIDTAQARAGAAEGLNQSLDRLVEYIARASQLA